MKGQIHSIREIIPIVLLSVLLFVSCTQLPIIDQAAEPEPQTVTLEVPTEVPTTEEPALERGQTEDIAQTDLPVPETDTADEQRLVEEGRQSTEGGPNDEVLALSDIEQVLEEAIEEELSAYEMMQETLYHQNNVEVLCEEIGDKLGSVSVEDCMIQELQYAGSYSVNARPLTLRDFEPRNAQQKNVRVLIIGGIHGDEYSSISIMFKWMTFLKQSGGNSFSWRFLPSVNPDGLLDGQAIRQNASGVDLNRNFPSQDWNDKAHDYWENSTGENPRRYPGIAAGSEPEVRWMIEQIQQYEPEVIVSVHAPYHLLDFDGPSDAPEKIGDLYLHQLGVYPGSLGNYAGLDLGIPVVTLELPSAGIMPSQEQIEMMWIDMLSWLNERTQSEQNASL